MKSKNLLDNKTAVLGFIFLLVFALKFPILNTPYIRDTITVYIGPAMKIRDAGLNPLYLGIHPPVYYELLALNLKIFGESRLAGHIFDLVVVSLLLFYTYLLGKRLYNSTSSFFAALTLFFSPLIFAQSGMVNLDTLFAFFSITTVYYYVKGKTITYLIFGSILVLTKEPGVLIILGILLYHFLIKNSLLTEVHKNKGAENFLIYTTPIIVMIFWFLINKYVHGWIFHPSYVTFFQLTVFPQEFLRRLHQLFFADYHFIITTAILCCLLPFKEFYTKNKRRFLAILACSLLIFLICYTITPLLHFIKDYFNLDLIQITGKNLTDLYELKFSLAYLLFLTLFILFYSKQSNTFQDIKTRFYKIFNEKTLLLVICIAIPLLFFSFIRYGYNKRYLILVYPLFFITGIASLKKISLNRSLFLVVMAIILILFASQWYASKPIFGTCEENMLYLDVIDTHVEMSRFIEKNYKDKIVLTEVPELDELTFPFAGYVTQPIKSIEGEIDPFRRGINKTLPLVPKEKFDLVYLSNGGYNEEYLLKTINFYNLSLIKKFEKNGKITYLYG
jgi:4-amino-4-deoxy-L-arabinose transferase-like glycosyltransferase